MHHPGPLSGLRPIEVTVETGAAAALDRLADAGEPSRRFLRRAWFAAAAAGGEMTTLVARCAVTGEPRAAIPLRERRFGPLAIREVPGSYWPFRSFPVAAGLEPGELAALLGSPAAQAALGRAWRLGPVYADDPVARLLPGAARASGWTMLTRRLGTSFVIDVRRQTAAGGWPSTKTLRKNRWLERRLAAAGALGFEIVTGSGWTAAQFERLAAVEAESWVGRRTDGAGAKFLNRDHRRIWEAAVADSVIARSLSCSMLTVGGAAAAFTFSLRCGDTAYFLANGYSERFAWGSPGRVLLYRDFQAAVAEGVKTIGWGAGDGGYKGEMGAEAGAEIVDHLFLRGPVAAALARPLWRSRLG